MDRNTPEAQALIRKAIKAQEDADRAFARYFQGAVVSSSAAQRLENKAQEALADVRLQIDGGDQIEWELASY